MSKPPENIEPENDSYEKTGKDMETDASSSEKSETERPLKEDGDRSPSEDHDYEATVALTRREMRGQDNDEPDDHEQTVMLSREEMGIPDESTPEDHEATVALTRQEMGIAEPFEEEESEDEDDHEATVALTREEMGIFSPEDARRQEEDHEATVALTREEMGISSSKKDDSGQDKDHEATVAMTREEMGIASYFDEEPVDHEATVALSREQMGIPSTSESEGFDKTVAMTRDQMDMDTTSEADDHEATVALTREQMGIPSTSESEGYEATVALTKDMNLDASRLSGHQDLQRADRSLLQGIEIVIGNRKAGLGASGLERQYYRNAVKKDHDQNKYLFQEHLFSGGMGAILQMLDQDLHRISAMKVILPGFKNDADSLSSFITEAKITGMLEHPNIIPVHEIGLLDEAGLYFTMKLAQGESLKEILVEMGTGNPEYVQKYTTYYLLNIFRKICDSVSYAHSKDVIHQDIKPHNVVVGSYGEVLLMDWGLARYVGRLDTSSDPDMVSFLKEISIYNQENPDLIKGSPAYISPEQVEGDPRRIDKQSDIFLLGSTLYHIFTLSPPYTGNSMKEVVFKARTCDLIAPEERNPSLQIPEEICRIIKKAMEKDKKDRYQQVDDMIQDIDDLIAGKWSQQEKKYFDQGEMLMTEGDAGEEGYLIVKGKVEVFKEIDGHRTILGTIGEGDIIGEMSLITEETRSASIQALEKTEVVVLTKNLVSQNLKKLPPYMEKIVSTLTERLRTANTRLAEVRIDSRSETDRFRSVVKWICMMFSDGSGVKEKAAAMTMEDLVRDIAADLGIPGENVRKIIEKAGQTGILEVESNRISAIYPEKLDDGAGG